MNILFISNWGVNDGLSKATIYPHLQILQDKHEVTKVLLVTMERTESIKDIKFHLPFDNIKIEHHPFNAAPVEASIHKKMLDYVRIPRSIKKWFKSKNIDLIIARGTPAGAIAYKLYKKTKTPFLVESFEPHAEYMFDSGVWSKSDPRYIFQKKWENSQIENATGLMPVSNNYKEELIKRAVSENRIYVVPCSADMTVFNFSEATREKVRNECNIQLDEVVGIYVGKFGGMYLKEEAIKLFKSAQTFFGQKFRLVILSPQPAEQIKNLLKAAFENQDAVIIKSVNQKEVANYLNAADFAFATYKPGETKKHLSPIKIGEYWACGLPVVLTKGVGDDSDIIESEGGGILFDPSQIEHVNWTSLQRQLFQHQNWRQLAKKYRSPVHAKKAYEYFFDKITNRQSEN